MTKNGLMVVVALLAIFAVVYFLSLARPALERSAKTARAAAMQHEKK